MSAGNNISEKQNKSIKYMIRFLGYTLITLLMSLYCFPFEFTFLPGINTKMMLAVAGVVFYLMYLARTRYNGLSKNMVVLSILAMLVSFWSFVSITVNNTSDTAYVTYIVSMWVWIGGAYTVLSVIRSLHGTASVILITNYLAAASVFQCLSALAIDLIPAVKAFSINYFNLGQEWLDSKEVDRIYGFGAALDPAGVRFALVLTLITGVLTHIAHTVYSRYLWAYIVSFIIIAVVGNMIARTTTVGIIVSAVIVAWHLIRDTRRRTGVARRSYRTFWSWTVILLCCVVACYYFYNISESFRENLRFGFEGFFSLVEKGTWQVQSNDKLMTMYVWPETTHTWLFGDGYFSNPYYTDPYFIGEYVNGYYMGTDVGYLRFIFYFGLPGLLLFSWFFIRTAKICGNISPDYRRLFMFILLVHFIVWLKVATDSLVVFALFLMLDPGEDSRYNERIRSTDRNRFLSFISAR